MTRDKQFLLQELPPPTSFPFSSTSFLFQFSHHMLHIYTRKLTHILFDRCTQTTHALLLYFPGTHSHPYTLLLSPRFTTGCMKHSHPNGYHQFLPIAVRVNHVRKSGTCVLLPFYSLFPFPVKGSFGCFLSVKRKRNIHKAKGSDS